MNPELATKEIGKRISALRKRKGLSQADLAKRMNISRSTLAHIELGNRKLDAVELRDLALILEFSLDEFMAGDDLLADQPAWDPTGANSSPKERIAVPKLQLAKFRNVLLYILERCAGKPNVGETVLYKLLYFADFNHYELYEDHLTGASYRKLPYGPVPQKIDTILRQMMDAGQLQRLKTEYYGLPQTRYIPLAKANLTELKASEKEVLDRVIAQMSDWSAAAISHYSHQDMPWMASKEGAVIRYELAFYREPPFSVRNYEE